MGIYDRDYYRREGPSFLGSISSRGMMCWWLVGVNVLVFILQLLGQPRAFSPEMFEMPQGMSPEQFLEHIRRMTSNPVTDALILDSAKVLHGEVWRLLTYAFLHSVSAPDHIFWNMLFLLWFGTDIEDIYGPREFLGIYLFAAVAGGVAHVLLAAAHLVPMHPMPGGPQGFHLESAQVLGASGAVTAVLVLCALHYPTRIILVGLILPIPIWLFVAFSVAKDFFSFIGQAGGHVAVDVHLAGAAFAFFYYRSGGRVLNLLPSLGSWRRRLTRPRLRVYREEPAAAPVKITATPPPAPADEQLEARMDAILEKISRSGKESLTEPERELLLRASEAMKRRRH
jgi:membrane associated rhomboid family serine protease